MSFKSEYYAGLHGRAHDVRDAYIAELERQRDEAMALLRRFADAHNDKCYYDHHGYCQAHFLETDCTVKATKELLARIDAVLKT